jgi:uncharacterized membrane protein
MTASKSSRARNARAQASAAKNAAGGTGTAVKNGSAASNGTAGKNGTAAKNGTVTKNGTPAKNGTAAKNGGANRNGTVVQDRGQRNQAGTAVRNGSAGRGARTQLVPDETTQTGPAVWLQIATFVLALAGLGVSIYLTIAHFTESALLGCSESGLVNCTRVTTSPQSYVFGIPVAVLGLAFFLFAVAIMSPWAWQSTRREIHLLRIASLVVAMGFVLYLIYAELFTIGSICLYCTSVHAITFALFVLTMIAAAAWGLKPGAPWRLGRAQPSGSAA